MIRLFSGTPGSGKSLHTAQILKNRIRDGQPVVCNFPLDISKCWIRRGKKNNFHYVPNDQLNPSDLIRYSVEYFNGKRVREGELLLVIDECQLLFNSREWQKSGRAEWLSFFTQHRKFGYDVILIAQFDGMVDKQIRSLIEYNVIHRKVSNFGIGGKIISLCSLGGLFVAVKVWYPLNEKVGSEFFRSRKSLYTIYDSYISFEQST